MIWGDLATKVGMNDAGVPVGMVNVGSKEDPLYVPAEALSSDEKIVNAFWEACAIGSIVLDDEQRKYLMENSGE